MDLSDPGVFRDKYALARRLSTERHEGQHSGEGGPYTDHLREVEATLRRFGVDERGSEDDRRLLIAAHLHDLFEDTRTTLEEIARDFDPDMARLVAAVTLVPSGPGLTAEQAKLRTMEKVLEHPLGRKLKLADRITNVESYRRSGLVRYADTYPAFRRILYRAEGDVVEQAMWGRLDELLAGRANGPLRAD